jgi:hypothetical protein
MTTADCPEISPRLSYLLSLKGSSTTLSVEKHYGRRTSPEARKSGKRDNLRDIAQLLVSEILTFGGREFDASALNHLKYSKLSAMA